MAVVSHSATAAVVKYHATLTLSALAPILAVLPFDPWWLLFVPMGLVIGWLARAGRMMNDKKSWRAIGHDLGISIMIGGAHAILAAMIIAVGHLGYLTGLAVSFGCAFSSVASVNTWFAWIQHHYMDDFSGPQRKAQLIAEAAEVLVHDLEQARIAKEAADKLKEDGQP